MRFSRGDRVVYVGPNVGSLETGDEGVCLADPRGRVTVPVQFEKGTITVPAHHLDRALEVAAEEEAAGPEEMIDLETFEDNDDDRDLGGGGAMEYLAK